MRTPLLSNSEITEDVGDQIPGISDVELKQISDERQGQKLDFRFPFGDWFGHPWSKQQNLSDTRFVANYCQKGLKICGGFGHPLYVHHL